MQWRLYRGRRSRSSRLIQRSLHGLVFVAQSQDTPDVGKRLSPHVVQHVDKYGFKSAVVRRVTPLADKSNLVYAEIEA